MSFEEVQFPPKISYGSEGGPVRQTNIMTLANGYESRNTTWSQSRHSYNVAYGVRTYNDLHEVKTFFEARQGSLIGFRFKDWADFKSVPPQNAVTANDQVLGVGNGTQTVFNLVKAYTSGSATYSRRINKPVSGTVLVSLNGVNQSSGWTVNTTTGVITFSSAPANGVIVRAGFEFDVPVRFDTDELPISLAAFKHGELADIILIEVRV